MKNCSGVRQTLENLNKHADISDPGHTAWRKLMMKHGEKRNYSAQEVVFHSWGIPLVECPKLKFQDVNLHSIMNCWMDEKTKRF